MAGYIKWWYLAAAGVVAGCISRDTARTAAHFAGTADSLSGLVQQALLKEVSGAVQKGGTAYAVDFCNLRAIPLTDSISQANKVSVRRITGEPRNPGNALLTPMDSTAWALFENAQLKGEAAPDYILATGEDGRPVFYKPIRIAMPTCLKCHGGAVNDIEAPTLARIREKYPEDKATGYRTGMLRGLWKVTK